MTGESKRYMTTGEMAKRIGYSKGYVCKLARMGLFGPVKVAKGHYLFTEDNIHHYINGGEPTEGQSAHALTGHAEFDPKFAFDGNRAEPKAKAETASIVTAVPVEATRPSVETKVYGADMVSELGFHFKNDELTAKVQRLCLISGKTSQELIAVALDMLLGSEKVKHLLEAYEYFESERKTFTL